MYLMEEEKSKLEGGLLIDLFIKHLKIPKG